MLTVDECKSCAADYKSLAKEPGVSKERAAVLKNISMAWAGLAGQLERLAEVMEREAKAKPPPDGSVPPRAGGPRTIRWS
jgi:hypothetical protein